MSGKAVMARLAVPLGMAFLTGLYAFGVFNIRVQFDEGFVGPKFLPGLLCLIAFLLLGKIIWGEVRGLQSEEVDAETPAETRIDQLKWRPFWVAVSILAYVAAFKFLGYPLATFLLAAALISLFSETRPGLLKLALLSAAITVVFYGLFAVAFSVRLSLLPEGVLWILQ